MKNKTPRKPKNFSFRLPPTRILDYNGYLVERFRWKEGKKAIFRKKLKALKEYAKNHHRHGFKKLKKEFLRAGEWTQA